MKHTKKWIAGFIISWVALVWTLLQVAVGDVSGTIYSLIVVVVSVLFLVSLDEQVG